MARIEKGQKMYTTEFGRFALNSAAVPEKFEEWMSGMYGISPRTKKKKRK